MFDALFFKNKNEVLVENTLWFDGTSLGYKKTPSDSLQAELEITQIISDSTGIIDFQKFKTLSPLFAPGQVEDIIDRKQFSLPSGQFKLKIIIQDLVKNNAPVEFSQPLLVPDFTIPGFSSLEFLAAISTEKGNSIFHKNGFLTEPYVSDYYPPEVTKVLVYTELNHSEQLVSDSGVFAIRCAIENEQGKPVLDMVRYSRHTVAEVLPLVKAFDITELPSGNYQFVIEMRNKNNELLLGKKRKFTRNNPDHSPIDYTSLITEATFVSPIKSLDTLRNYINYLHPIAEQADRTYIENQNEFFPTLESCKQFFYGFWLKRNPKDPSISWAQYKQLVHMANANFGNRVRKGYQTDRGRIFLKYGPPNSRMEQPNEPEAVPYEIWHYYRLGKYSNRKFVFYNPEVVTNDFKVLHSDVPGEIQNPNWLAELYKKTVNSNWSQGAEQNRSPYGRRALEFFNNPR